MATSPGPEPVGILGSLRALGGTVLELAGTRVELAVVELRQEGERRKEMLVLALAAAVFLGIALLFASFFVVAAFWDSHRLAAVGGVTLFHLAAGAGALLVLRRKARLAPPPFEATLAEIARDREMMRGLGE